MRLNIENEEVGQAVDEAMEYMEVADDLTTDVRESLSQMLQDEMEVTLPDEVVKSARSDIGGAYNVLNNRIAINEQREGVIAHEFHHATQEQYDVPSFDERDKDALEELQTTYQDRVIDEVNEELGAALPSAEAPEAIRLAATLLRSPSKEEQVHEIAASYRDKRQQIDERQDALDDSDLADAHEQVYADDVRIFDPERSDRLDEQAEEYKKRREELQEQEAELNKQYREKILGLIDDDALSSYNETVAQRADKYERLNEVPSPRRSEEPFAYLLTYVRDNDVTGSMDQDMREQMRDSIINGVNESTTIENDEKLENSVDRMLDRYEQRLEETNDPYQAAADVADEGTLLFKPTKIVSEDEYQQE